jgi:hypothetical protein
MKRLTLAILVACGFCGCVPGSFLTPPADKSDAKSLEPVRATAAAPVTASQINAANAHEKAQSLRRELDRDMEQAIDSNEAKK